MLELLSLTPRAQELLATSSRAFPFVLSLSSAEDPGADRDPFEADTSEVSSIFCDAAWPILMLRGV